VPAAAGYNFALLLRWLWRLLRALFQVLFHRRFAPNTPKFCRSIVLHGRLSVHNEEPSPRSVRNLRS
jgi:hypothetical protein